MIGRVLVFGITAGDRETVVWGLEMTGEEYEVKIKQLEAENKRLKDGIIALETAIKEFAHAI